MASLTRNGNPRTLPNMNSATPYIREFVPFYAGNLTGTDRPYWPGILPAAWVEAFDADRSRMDYAVYSYNTPIAWHTPDGWTVPSVSYSNSTYRHQSIVRSAVRAWESPESIRTRIDAVTVKIEFFGGQKHREWMLSDDRIVRVSTGKYSRVTDADMEAGAKAWPQAYFFDYSKAGRIVGMTLTPVWPLVK